MFVGSKVSDTRYEVTIPANTTHNSRSATFRWVQEETSDQQSRKITQTAADDDYDFRISLVSGGPYYSSVEVDYPAGGSTDAPTYTFYLYSRKNGALFSNSVAKVESNANWITITAQDRPAFTVAINSDSASRDGIITLTQKESGHTCQIKVHQAGADVEEWRYTFNVDPTALTFGSAGGSQSLKVTCYKTKWINDVEQPSTKTPVDWYSEPKNSWLTGVDAPNSQGGGVGSCGISADANSGIYRSGEVTIVNSETNFAVRIIVNQAAYVPDVYVFTWKDGSTSSKIKTAEWHQVAIRDISGEYEVISTKNGSSHPYSLVSKPSWVTSASISGARLTIDVGEENTSATDRTGNLIFEQDDSGKRLVIVFTQKAQEVSYEFAWDAANPTLFTHTVMPGANMATVLAQDLISRKSSDGWVTESLVGATVTTKPSWLTVSLQPNQLDKMLSVILSGTATLTPGTYPVIITQNESGEAVMMNIVVESKVQNLISISSASYEDGKYNVYFQAADPVASDVQITYTLIKTGANGNTNAVTMRTGQRVAGVIGLEVTRNDYEAVRIEFVSPQSDSTYAYTYSAATVPINYPVDVSASCRFYGSFGTMVSSDHPMIIPLTSVVNFDGSTSNVASYLKIPTEYNAEGTALQLDGEVSFNVEANNNTTNSMKSIEVELLYSTTESDVGTDYGALVSSWIENYPVGGKYITIEVQNETVNSSLLDVTDRNTPIYLWFNVRVVYEGWDNPMISCTTSSISFTLTSR